MPALQIPARTLQGEEQARQRTLRALVLTPRRAQQVVEVGGHGTLDD
jgi:hypothetical protein